ncbi:MAG: BON domain-containing protein [Acidobacteria bacterium]|nr:BON domain-containing protein [Acidobacteriota bacterium]
MRNHQQHHESRWRSDDEFERANSGRRAQRAQSDAVEHGADDLLDGDGHGDASEPWDVEWVRRDDPREAGAGAREVRGDLDLPGEYRSARSNEAPVGPRRGHRGANDLASPGSHAGKGPRGYRRTDERIWEDVCERLACDPDLDASDIEVSVSDGDVQLEGDVASEPARRAAEEIAASAFGVQRVENRLRVRLFAGADHPVASAPPPVIEGYTAGASDGSRKADGEADGERRHSRHQ